MKLTNNNGRQTLCLTNSERLGRDAAYLVISHVLAAGRFSIDDVFPIQIIDGVEYRQYETTDPSTDDRVIVYLRKNMVLKHDCWTPTAAEFQWKEEYQWDGEYVPNLNGEKLVFSSDEDNRRPLKWEYSWDGEYSYCRWRMIFTFDIDKTPILTIEDLKEGISDEEFRVHTMMIHEIPHELTVEEELSNILSGQ
jgi:hypothetical protein